MNTIGSLGYYCGKDKKFVLVAVDYFYHPDEGRKTCLVCRKCGTMVYLKEQEGVNA